MRDCTRVTLLPDNWRQTFLRSVLSTRLADNAHKCRNGGEKKIADCFQHDISTLGALSTTGHLADVIRRTEWGDFRDALSWSILKWIR